MKSKRYSLLYFHHLPDKYSKWIFPLHEGENVIGSDKDFDIVLYLNESEDFIDSIKCQIIVDKNQNNIRIKPLNEKGTVKLENDNAKKLISPGETYVLKNKSVFYLGDNLKFTLINGTLDEINKFFIGQRMEDEYQKWKQFITYQENNIKLNLNLQRNESLNKSIISNLSNNNNNNNLNNSIQLNNNNNNQLLNSNIKDVNRMGFNNFDEVPDDNWLNEKENSEFEFSPFKPSKDQNQIENQNLINNSINISPKMSQEINLSENNNIIKIEMKDMIFCSKEQKIKNNYKENLINNNDNISKDNYDENNIDFLSIKNDNNKYSYEEKEKNLNSDDKTAKIIKELLGENNLELIINKTNFKNIKNFDIIYKKANKAKMESGNFDIKFTPKTNIFGNK